MGLNVKDILFYYEKSHAIIVDSRDYKYKNSLVNAYNDAKDIKNDIEEKY